MNQGTQGTLAALAVCFPLSLLPILANDSYPGDDDAAVPARIRVIEGGATLQREREQDRIEATVNMPVFPGDRIDVEGGPLELQLPEGSLIWLDEGASIQLLAVRDSSDDSREGTVLKLQEGTLEGEIHGESSQQPDVRIDTPESSVYLMSRGRFRVEAESGTTTVTSYRGVAELAGDEGSMLVRGGQQSHVESGAAPEEPWPVNTLRRDLFGDWCEERAGNFVADSNAEEQEFVENVPRPVRNYVSELNYYGDWQYVAAFGWVWRPTVIQTGWRPYYSGYWTWCPRGWTWVSYEPWGWLPYHYGRWSWVTTAGWVWIPGTIYSGAWVSWAVTPTYVGWCPLDFYNRPAYVSFNYTNVTVSQYGGGWNFLPLNRWGGRNLNRDIVRADRVPQLHGAVTTRTLPHFDARQVRVQPETVQRVVRDTSPPSTAREPSQGARGMSFRQMDRRELTAPRKLTHPPAGADLGRRQVGGTSGRSGPSLTNPEKERGLPSRREFRSIEPMRPRRLDGQRGVPRPGRDSLAGPLRPEPPSPRPRVPLSSDDPSRRVLNRILREGSPAQGQHDGGNAVPGRGSADRPRVESGSRPTPPTPRIENRPPRPSPSRSGASSPRNDAKQKKDKP